MCESRSNCSSACVAGSISTNSNKGQAKFAEIPTKKRCLTAAFNKTRYLTDISKITYYLSCGALCMDGRVILLIDHR